jgi:hypothetical protein
MNAKKLFLGLVTATVLMTPFATIQPASATDNIANSTVTAIDGQPEMLLAKGSKPKPKNNPKPPKNPGPRNNRKNSVDNRHNISNPHQQTTRWLRTMKQTRVAELFKTKNGLRGHAQQIEQEIARVNKNLDGKNGKDVAIYRAALVRLKTSIANSANGAKFDFNKFEIKFTPLVPDLFLERRGGKLFVNGRQSGRPI